MTRESMLIVFGILVFLAPFSGLPMSWLSWVLPVFGILIAGIGITLRAKRHVSSPPPPPSPSSV